jgi:hypothetical protein
MPAIKRMHRGALRTEQEIRELEALRAAAIEEFETQTSFDFTGHAITKTEATMTTINKVELKNVKIAGNLSEETIAFTGALYINGKKAADVKNAGHGGDNATWFKDRDLGMAFEAWAAALPPMPVTDDDIAMGLTQPLPMSADLWISLEVGRIDDERFWRRKCTKGVLIILTKHATGEYGEYKNTPYTPSIAAKLRERHGEELVEIINERFTAGG